LLVFIVVLLAVEIFAAVGTHSISLKKNPLKKFNPANVKANLEKKI